MKQEELKVIAMLTEDIKRKKLREETLVAIDKLFEEPKIKIPFLNADGTDGEI